MPLELRWHGASGEGTSEKEKMNTPERSELARLDELKGEDNVMSPPRGRSVLDCETLCSDTVTLKSFRRWAAIEE